MRPTITQATGDVFHVTGTDVNWTIVTDGDALTLIDAGYPGNVGLVESSIRDIGKKPENLEAVLVTHAHVDHIGSLPTLISRYNVPVFMAETELGFARRDYVESATPLQVAANSWRYGMAMWGLRIARAGGTKHIRLTDARAVALNQALDIPGNPVAIPTPGHTSGHTCYHLPGHGVIVTGDALCTAHATSRRVGPQFLLPLFSHDMAEQRHTITRLRELDADLILPGHGSLHRGAIREAVDQAIAS